MKNQYLKEIMKIRNLTFFDLWMIIHKEIPLATLSKINIGEVQITKEQVQILEKYLDLTETEIEYLRKLCKQNIVFESADYLTQLLSKVPKELKAGEFYETDCPFCNNTLVINKSPENGHVSIVCSKEGLLLIE